MQRKEYRALLYVWGKEIAIKNRVGLRETTRGQTYETEVAG